MFQYKSAMTIAAFTCIFMALFMTRVSFPEGSFRSVPVKFYKDV